MNRKTPFLTASLIVLLLNSPVDAALLDGMPNDGAADLIVDIFSGNVKIDTDGTILTGFILISVGDDGERLGGDGHFIPSLPATMNQHDPGLPLSLFAFSTVDEASSQVFDLTLFPPFSPDQRGHISGIINLGHLFASVPSNLNEDLEFTYTRVIPGIFTGTLITVPEPSTQVLATLALLSLLANCRLRRRA